MYYFSLSKVNNVFHNPQHLWKLAVEEAELFMQIKLMKDFFLLGRGELFLEFICQASPVLQNAPVGTSTRGTLVQL